MIDFQPVAMRHQRFSMPSGVREGGHAHDAWHLIRVEAGGFEEDDGRHGQHVRAGGWRLSPPGLAHELVAGETGAACINLHIRDRDLARRLFASVDRRHHFFDTLSPSPEVQGLAANHARVAAAIRQARGEDGDPPAWLEDLNTRIREPLSRVGEVSDRLGVSREHASREFHRFFGLAPAKARLLAAAERAVAMLPDAGRPFCDIAFDSGFYDQAHMIRTLRAVYGETPSALRKKLIPSH